MQITVIRQKGQAVLVEWENEGSRRAYVVASAVEDDQCSSQELEIGIPYGLPWREIVGDLVLTGEQIEDALKKHGIWTLEDLRKEPMRAAAALLAVHKMGVNALISRTMSAINAGSGGGEWDE